LVYSGLAKSNPVTAKGVEVWTHSAGKGASTSCPRALLAILHEKQIGKIFLMFCRARRIQNSSPRWDSTTLTPKWCSWIWVWRISKCLTWWAPSKRIGCFSVCDKSANWSLPQRRIRLCSQNCRNLRFWRMPAVFGRGEELHISRENCHAVPFSVADYGWRAFQMPLIRRISCLLL
jgi:hypothetical protein